MKIRIIGFFLLGFCLACDSSDTSSSSLSKGVCVYGPLGAKACVETTKEDCTNNFIGTWFIGEECGSGWVGS